VTTGCRKMHSEVLHDFYSSPNTHFQVGQRVGHGWWFLWGKLNVGESLVNGKVILQWILKKWGGRLLIGFIWFRRRARAWNFVYVSGPSRPKTKCMKIID
jgi:hypothetical protein